MFSFSKVECEKLALRMKSLDLLDATEKSLVEGVFHSAVELLSSEDAKCDPCWSPGCCCPASLCTHRPPVPARLPGWPPSDPADGMSGWLRLRRLPQIHQAIHHLKRGVGVHHSGLLPLLKEVTEILFQEGLLKARARPAVVPAGWANVPRMCRAALGQLSQLASAVQPPCALPPGCRL